MAAAVFAAGSDAGSDAGFIHCADGRVIAAFDLHACRTRRGEGPDRLQAHQRELGMETSYEDPGWAGAPTAAALALAGRATGVHLSRARYAADALFGPTEHLAPYA
ncbi:DUF6461 domain-containing protein [Nonomuraea sp. KM90]|uniref:DUF6461 domain-containing protein n=1 Tax=Nonomuraea sp. KM90 TaxID=3457428 RepID=UPI003FCC488D